MREHVMVSTDPWMTARAAAEAIRERTGGPHDVAVVLGSGWGTAVAEIGDARASVAMTELPGFPTPTVAGHTGLVTSLDVAPARRVLVFQGRSHLYEGYDASVVVHGVRAAVLAGCGIVVLTNAAGSLRPEVGVGRPVLISDHLNLTGRSPLAGPPPPAEVGPRFVDLTELYSPRLRRIARDVDPSLTEGVYACLPGPHYETPAEIRMLRTLGADLVGMSTVLEAIAARHVGAEVMALSLVTNIAAGLSAEGLDHGEVLAAGAAAAASLGRFLGEVIARA